MGARCERKRPGTPGGVAGTSHGRRSRREVWIQNPDNLVQIQLRVKAEVDTRRDPRTKFPLPDTNVGCAS